MTPAERLTWVDLPLADLKPHPANPRTITPARLASLARSIERTPGLLDARPLIALPTGEVIAGNQRLAALKSIEGRTHAPVIVVELDDTEAREWAIKDNNPWGEWEAGALAEYVHGIPADQIPDLGFTDEQLRELLDGTNLGDDVLPPPGDAGTGEAPEMWGVIVECDDEQAQLELLTELGEQGYSCRAIVG